MSRMDKFMKYVEEGRAKLAREGEVKMPEQREFTPYQLDFIKAVYVPVRELRLIAFALKEAEGETETWRTADDVYFKAGLAAADAVLKVLRPTPGMN